MPKRSVKINGVWLARLREKKHLSQKALAEAMGISLSRVQQITRPGLHEIFSDRFTQLADSLGMTLFELEALIAEKYDLEINDIDDGMPEDDRHVLFEISEFDMSVAAGGWTHVPEPASVYQKKQMEKGLFRIKIMGDSMKPDYEPGDLLEFRVLKFEDRLYINHDYYVQQDDEATFKRLVSMTEETLVFEAVNKKKISQANPRAT